MCTAGVKAIQALKAELPNTELLGVTVLTSFKGSDTRAMFTCSTEEAVMRLANIGSAGVDGFISSPKETEFLRAHFEMMWSLNTPAIRPKWSVVSSDDQNKKRVMTPSQTIKNGADRIIVGRPITQAKNPYDAVMRTLDEIVNVAK